MLHLRSADIAKEKNGNGKSAQHMTMKTVNDNHLHSQQNINANSDGGTTTEQLELLKNEGFEQF